MAARHGTAGHEEIFVVLLVCMKSLINPLMLNGHQIDSKSTGQPFSKFLTNNNRLWSIIVCDNAVHATQKSVSTTGSFNHGRIVLYNNSCATFQLAKLKLEGLIHPNPGPSMDFTTTANSRTSHHDSKVQLNISCLYMNARSMSTRPTNYKFLLQMRICWLLLKHG